MKKYKEIIIYTVILVLILGGGLYKIVPLVSNFFSIRSQVMTKYSSINDLQRQVDTLKQSEAQKASQNALADMKNIYKPDIAGEDAEIAFTVTFDDIINMAKTNAVKVYSLEYAYNPADDVFVKGAAGSYNVCQLTMDVIADYTNLQGFLDDLYKYHYLINIKSLKVEPYQKNKRLLLVELVLSLYTAK